MPKEATQESNISHTTTRTAIGDIDTITVSPKGDTQVDLKDGDEGDENGVQITDKVAAREDREEGGDGGATDEGGDGAPKNKNLTDDVGQRHAVKKPFRKTRDGRINELTREAREYERTAEQYRTELEAERAKNGTLAREKDTAEYAAALHYRDGLKAQKAMMTRQLKDAKDSADTAAEAEIQSKMSTVDADLSRAESWLGANADKDPSEKKPAKPAAEPEARAPAKPQPVQYTGETARWVSENPWFDAGSTDHDPAMAEYARNYATYIETELKRVGNQKAIGTPDYFELIDKRMREVYADRFGGDEGGDEEPAAQPQRGGLPRMQGGSNVAPARASQPGVSRQQPQGGNPNQVRLTQEQREIAHSLILKHPNGNSLTPREKEIKYAEGLRQTTRKGA